MNKDLENEIALRDKIVESLQQEVSLKNELIESQNDMIQTLMDNNAELKHLIERMLKNFPM
ncbi:hypothetical protein [Petrocella sp. FN5]|uniref:hypothetical protein n=1 Tax=Petrocella sp. FN5 TaxID=3032002 RepID=UPI0023DA95DD|nr:hypothetical protein [Petrocella sp. FN5]MDF1618782.1 hypothetical protein [Petrocella sp. FN5]